MIKTAQRIVRRVIIPCIRIYFLRECCSNHDMDTMRMKTSVTNLLAHEPYEKCAAFMPLQCGICEGSPIVPMLLDMPALRRDESRDPLCKGTKCMKTQKGDLLEMGRVVPRPFFSFRTQASLVRCFVFILTICLTSFDGISAERQPRRVLPAGIEISEADRAELEAGVRDLGKRIELLRTELKDKPHLLALLPDVIIFHKAVHWPLAYDEFLRANDVAAAQSLLRLGIERANNLRQGKAPWTTSIGLVVRGYVSRVDGSIQPYGLVVPESFQSPSPQRHRLDVWLHGRDNKLTELKFLSDRLRSPGQFTPTDTFVLHPYGRYCNAFKFIGEVDVFEGIEKVRESYEIDENRIAIRGFSMGGAGCWHLAAHHSGFWAAAAPGAGFAETAEYTRILSREPKLPWYEQKLWHWYDATDYAANLFNCPTIAYSGGIDKQKQAADIMARSMGNEGLELTHLIGPETGHKYHPKTKIEISRRIDRIVADGRNQIPRRVRFTTWTLRYNQMFWVTVQGMEKHWERARVEAEIVDDHSVKIVTENVSELMLSMPSGFCPLDVTKRPSVLLDGQSIEAPRVQSDRSWTAHFRRVSGTWRIADGAERVVELRKRHGLQGPIDDAFLDSFLMVLPSGDALNEKVGEWTAAAQAHAVEHWRRQFRGKMRIKRDDELTDQDISRYHLILWGDPASNSLLARIAGSLPIRWDATGVHFPDAIYPVDRYAPVFIYPNPLNQDRYVVVNSGVTFSEFGHLSNAFQTPKLPDYAILDLDSPDAFPFMGSVVQAGFFDEHWQLPSRGN